MGLQLLMLLVAAVLVLPLPIHAATNFTGTERQITTNAADQYDPAISGELVVYTDARNIDRDVYYFDLSTGLEHQVTAAQGSQELSDVFNGFIVYTDYSAGDVLLYDVTKRTTTNLTAGSPGQAVEPAIGSELVTWQDNRNGNWEIYARSLTTGVEVRVTNSPTPDMSPAASGERVVWEQCSSASSCDIALWDWSTQTSRKLTSTPGDERRPDISGNWVVYEGLRDGERDVYAYDLTTGKERRLELPGTQRNPNVSGDFVAFEDLNGGTSDIMVWHLPSDEVFQVTADVSEQFLNDIDGNRIVYTDDRNGHLDIYLFEFQLEEGGIDPAVDCRNLGNSIPLVDTTLTRRTGKPILYYVPFTATPSPALVCIENGPNGAHSVLAGFVLLNGRMVARPSDFLLKKDLIESKGTLSMHNRIWVLLASRPGSAIRVRVFAGQTGDNAVVDNGSRRDDDKVVDPNAPIMAEPDFEEERVERGGSGLPTPEELARDHALLAGEAAAEGIEITEAEMVQAAEDAVPQPGYGCSQSGPGSFAATALALFALLVFRPRPERARVVVRRSLPRKRRQ